MIATILQFAASHVFVLLIVGVCAICLCAIVREERSASRPSRERVMMKHRTAARARTVRRPRIVLHVAPIRSAAGVTLM